MSDTLTITEKTKATLTFNGWYQMLVMVCVVLWAYFSLRQDVSAAIVQSKENTEGLRSQQVIIQEMRMDLKAINDNVGWFRQQYERDMSRYIREKPER